MKQKGLIPENLFNREYLETILKDLSQNETTYYKAVLQNLFFATLNTPIKARDFRTEKTYRGKNKDFMNPNVYRFHKLFTNPEDMKSIFNNIPFLNGGLFECLDRTEDKGKHIRIDGFSDREDSQANVPNFLFYSDEQEVDLSKEYGTNKKNYTVRGIIDLLQTYNFTIDESTPVDVEIALDPELLGRVFENLLASYNPETATTARKATGSYYTPREIVDYMVTQSLKEYFKTKLPNIENIGDKLNNLLSYDFAENPFNNSETDILINSVNALKIIDPAVGSGAFPMGILQKLVLVLSKLGTHNRHWKKPLIQNCIYGVDIQPIATQIAKLRFFISLLVDEKIDREQENYGIEPLPNLELNFISANSLIGLNLKGQLDLKDPRLSKLEEELKRVREIYFRTSAINEKEKLREKDKEIRNKISALLKESGFPSEDTKKIADWDPYNSNKFADWFDPEWMFGVKDGFDIAIANPPYVRQEDIKEQKPFLQRAGYKVFNSTSDLYTYFYEKSYQILKPEGFSCFISSNKWMRAKYGEKLRQFFKEKTTLRQIIDFNGYKVFEATVDTNILLFQRTKPTDDTINILNVSPDFTKDTDISAYLRNHNLEMKQSALDIKCFTFADEIVMRFKAKIEKIGTPLKNWNVKIYRGVTTGLNEAFIIDEKTKNELVRKDKKSLEILKPILRGRDVNKWCYEFKEFYLIYTYIGIDIKKYQAIYEYLKQYKNQLEQVWEAKYGKKNWYELRGCDFYDEFNKEKIIWADINTENSFSFDNKKYFVSNTGYILTGENPKYLLSIINSLIQNFYFKQISQNLGEKGYRYIDEFIEQLPIPKISNTEQQPFIDLVDKILAITKNDDYLNNSTKQAKVKELEHQIDQMVYKLYDLTDEEIKNAEGNKK